MESIVIRLVIAFFALAWGIALFARAGNATLSARDPALRYYRIPLVPELSYVAAEAAFLIHAIVVGSASDSAVLSSLSGLVHLQFGIAYVLFCYRNLGANGLPLKGYVPLWCFAGLTAANCLVFALQFAFPGAAYSIHGINKAILGIPLLYAALCGVAARGRKSDFYTSTKGGFWVAVFCLAYFPLPGIADAFSLPFPFLEANRPFSLQLHPLRELVVLAILTFHLESVYSRFGATASGTRAALSSREAEVAALLLEGVPNAHIAERLNISLPTVKTHVRNVFRKYGVSSRVEFARASTRPGVRG